MKAINIHDSKSQLSRLLARVERGEEIVIARAGRPIAKLVRYQRAEHVRVPGRGKDVIHVREDFDAPLPDDLQRALGMKDE
jgi:prevent-host-death family protein